MIILVRVVQLSNPGSWTVFATNINVGGLHNIWQPIISLLGIIILGIQIHVNCLYILTVHKVFHTRSCRIHAFWLQDLMQYCTSTILVGGAITILKNMKTSGKDDLYYVPSHQHNLAIKTRMAYLATLSHQNIGNLRIQESSSIKNNGLSASGETSSYQHFHRKKQQQPLVGWIWDVCWPIPSCFIGIIFQRSFHATKVARSTWVLGPSSGTDVHSVHGGQVTWDFGIHHWLVVDLPLWKIYDSQLGWWHYQYMENIIQMFQTTNQIKFLWLMGWSMYIDIINVGFT